MYCTKIRNMTKYNIYIRKKIGRKSIFLYLIMLQVKVNTFGWIIVRNEIRKYHFLDRYIMVKISSTST